MITSTLYVGVRSTYSYTFVYLCVHRSNGWEFLACRLWIGAWVGLFLLVGVATDASALVCFITRFTEENFAFLIAVIFIKSSVEKLVSLWHQYPITPTLPCQCLPEDGLGLEQLNRSSGCSVRQSSHDYYYCTLLCAMHIVVIAH